MNLDAGRSKLYSAMKTLTARWEATDLHWQDSMRRQFEEESWIPLEDLTAAALGAIDQMSTVLHQMRRECEGFSYDIYANG